MLIIELTVIYSVLFENNNFLSTKLHLIQQKTCSIKFHDAKEVFWHRKWGEGDILLELGGQYFVPYFVHDVRSKDEVDLRVEKSFLWSCLLRLFQGTGFKMLLKMPNCILSIARLLTFFKILTRGMILQETICTELSMYLFQHHCVSLFMKYRLIQLLYDAIKWFIGTSIWDAAILSTTFDFMCSFVLMILFTL